MSSIEVLATLTVDGTRDKLILKSKLCSKTNEKIYVLLKKKGNVYRSSIKFTKLELLMFLSQLPATYTNGYKKFNLRKLNNEVLLTFYVYDKSKLDWHLECTLSLSENNFRELVTNITPIIFDNH